LVGNASYANRGCEAIVRGTMGILRSEFGSNISADCGVVDTPSSVGEMDKVERDVNISNFSMYGGVRRLSLRWWTRQLNRLLGTGFEPGLWGLARRLDGRVAALQVGGDNFSFDYGRPDFLVNVNKYLLSKKIPVFIWGASIGPFSSDPEYERGIMAHFRTLSGIFVRESETQRYLASHGVVDNVWLVADPAFLLEARQPSSWRMPPGYSGKCAGVNLSPLVANFRPSLSPHRRLEQWTDYCVNLLNAFCERCDFPLLLIPHVITPFDGNDDWMLLQKVAVELRKRNRRVEIVPRDLDASELKWVIAQCFVFAGARTHSTIAALSSCIPTLSLSYSVKAIGINRDVLGTDRYCIPVSRLDADIFVSRMKELGDARSQFVEDLRKVVPIMKSRALSAGRILRTALESRRD